jgi:hypothetical protein
LLRICPHLYVFGVAVVRLVIRGRSVQFTGLNTNFMFAAKHDCLFWVRLEPARVLLLRVYRLAMADTWGRCSGKAR